MTAGFTHELDVVGGRVRLSVSARSETGHVRSVNEDSLLAEPPVFLVADGMGGHSFGDRASRSVVASFRALTEQEGAPSPEDVMRTIHQANTDALALSGGQESLSGTTLAGVALVQAQGASHWMAFNVGDSRVYGWDGRTLRQLTVDHSAVQELVDAGQITAAEAATHPHRNVITRAVGVHDAVEADSWMLPLRERQTFVACSDGLTKELDDDLIAGILADRTRLSPDQTVADRLVDAALAAGGSDNVSVVVVDCELIGAPAGHDDTLDRGMPGHLETTRPRP